MNVAECYQQAIDRGDITYDPQQAAIIQQLLSLQKQLQKTPLKWWQRWRQSSAKTQGFYLWGGVGRGKTFLLDLFYDCVPVDRKLRIHFHRFMQQVHLELKQLQGHANPLDIVARHFTMQAQLIILDEFMVTDITDAMILANLLKALFARDVCLLATSNIPPDNLYKSGLQRSRFLPAIDLIKKHMQVQHLETPHDYRLQTLEQQGVYFSPLNAQSEQAMQHCFAMYAHHEGKVEPIIIHQRPISTLCVARHVVWFDFNVICNVPRSQQDYLAIADQFDTVLISHVPQITPDDVTRITYFINLVDVFYDAGRVLILSSEVPINAIYTNGAKQFEFERTKSRLREMQSHRYLAALD